MRGLINNVPQPTERRSDIAARYTRKGLPDRRDLRGLPDRCYRHASSVSMASAHQPPGQEGLRGPPRG
jgi:hypothetical protein